MDGKSGSVRSALPPRGHSEGNARPRLGENESTQPVSFLMSSEGHPIYFLLKLKPLPKIAIT